VLTAITVYIVSYLAYPVTGIKVERARMLPQTEVWNAVPDRASLLTLNSTLLERRLKADPWVKGVEVSKDWRSGIVTVQVEERAPILRGRINGRQAVFAADGTELPGIGGTDLKSVPLDVNRLEEILEAGKTLEENGVRVESVAGVGPGGVEVVVAGRRVVFSGAVEAGQARALPEIMEQNPEAPVFDLRSPERVVAGARSDKESDG
jgi:cell division protein FtsQ